MYIFSQVKIIIFQNNLLASGGSDSEIYIWDLTNPTSPMTPGAKSQVIIDTSH